MRLLDLFTNKEAEADINKLQTIYMVTDLELVDLGSLMSMRTDMGYE